MAISLHTICSINRNHNIEDHIVSLDEICLVLNMVFVSVSLYVVKASFSLQAMVSLIVGPDLANLVKVLFAKVNRRDVKPQRERDAANPDGAEGGHETVSVE